MFFNKMCSQIHNYMHQITICMHSYICVKHIYIYIYTNLCIAWQSLCIVMHKLCILMHICEYWRIIFMKKGPGPFSWILCINMHKCAWICISYAWICIQILCFCIYFLQVWSEQCHNFETLTDFALF